MLISTPGAVRAASWSRAWSEEPGWYAPAAPMGSGELAFVLHARPVPDTVLLRIDASGAVAWQKRIEYPAWPGKRILGVALGSTTDGAVVMASTIESYSGDTLVKLDSTGGSILWWQGFAIQAGIAPLFRSVVPLPGGGLRVAGRAASATGQGWPSGVGLIAELGSGGQLLWQSLLGNFGRSLGFFATASTPDGGFVALGADYIVFGPYGDSWMVKYRADGTIAWQRTIGLDPALELHDAVAMIVTRDGRIVTAGRAPGGGLWLLVLDPDGKPLLSRVFHSRSGVIEATALVQTPDDGFLIGGLQRGVVPDLPLLLRTDGSGDLLWARSYAHETSSGYLSDVWVSAEPDGSLRAGGRLGAPKGAWLASLNADGTGPGVCLAADPDLSWSEVPPVIVDTTYTAPPEALSATAIYGRLVDASLTASDPCCAATLAAIEGLVAARRGDDVLLSWTPATAAAGYHVWTVGDRRNIERARQTGSPPAVAVAGCSPAAPALTPACADLSAVPRDSPGILYYQVRGRCDPALEGP